MANTTGSSPYPSAYNTFTQKVNATASTLGTNVLAEHINDLQDAVVALQTWTGAETEFPDLPHEAVPSQPQRPGYPDQTVGSIITYIWQSLKSLVPVGSLLPYAGDASTTVPDKWLLCDGKPIPPAPEYDELRTVLNSTTTPDLTDGLYPQGRRGPLPANPYVQATFDTPAHVHTLANAVVGATSVTTSGGGSHGHTVTTGAAGVHSHRMSVIHETGVSGGTNMVNSVTLHTNFPDVTLRRMGGEGFSLKELDKRISLSVAADRRDWAHKGPAGNYIGMWHTDNNDHGTPVSHTHPNSLAQPVGNHTHTVPGHSHTITGTTGTEGSNTPRVVPKSYQVAYLIRAYN